MRKESNLRKNDEYCAKIVSDYLDKNFYSTYTCNPNRIDTFEEQIKGIDITFEMNHTEYVCDEKAAIQYVNKPLNTFALELSFIDRSDNLHDGWLIDEEKVNNSFLFIWIEKASKDKLSCTDDIEQLQIALIDRQKIFDYLYELGWDRGKLLIKTKRIRDCDNEYLGNISINGCKFSYSNFLVEKPVNILLSKHKIIELSDYHKIFYKNE